MRLLLLAVHPMHVQVDYHDDNEDMDDGEIESDDNKNDQLPGDPAGVQCGSRGLRDGCGPVHPKEIEISGTSFHELAFQMSNLFSKG